MNENLENTQIPLKFLNRRSKIIHSDSELDNFIKSTILEWAQNDFTCPNAIQTYIYQTIQPHSMKLYFSQCYNNIHSMKSHIDLVQNINSHIWALLSCRPAVTFLDIYKMIEVICGNSHHRLLGPLTKIPIVKSCIFGNIDIVSQTPPIRLSDLICDCASFLTEKIATSRKTDEIAVVNSQSEKQFLHFLLKKYHVNDFNSLGVKIVNFKALRDAAYAAKGDSFHKLIESGKMMKLLRSDVKNAIENIRINFAGSPIFQMDSNKTLHSLSHFANLSFADAIKQFFQPFLDEEERIMRKHSLDSGARMEHEDDSLAVVRNIMDCLMKENIHGRLFQLAAIAGTMHDCHRQMTVLNNVSPKKRDRKSESWQQLISLDATEWRSRIFLVLLSDLNQFNRLSLLNGDSIENCLPQLGTLLQTIVDKCLAISHLFGGDGDSDGGGSGDIEQVINGISISPYKQQHLSNLASCCRAIANAATDPECLSHKRKLTKLQLDLFPQAYQLLIMLLSRGKLIKPHSTADNHNDTITVNSDVIECIFVAKLWHQINRNTDNQTAFSLQSVHRLERLILDALQMAAWPLDGSFHSFFSSRNDIVRAMVDAAHAKNECVPTESNNGNSGQCRCIALREEFLRQLIRQQPAAISLDQWVSHTLPTIHGVSPLPVQLATMWHDPTFRQSHLLADGLPAAMDLRGVVTVNGRIESAGSAILQPNDMAAITDAERVMRAISAVPLLENVPLALKWNALYRRCWGDISQFVNDHRQLASAFNVRLLHSEMGVVRLCVAVTSSQVDSALESVNANGSGCEELVGLMASLLLLPLANDGQQSSSIDLKRILDALVARFDTACVSAFCIAALAAAPSELIVDMATQVVHPLLSLNDDSKITGVLSDLDSSIVSVLNQCLPQGHPLLSAVNENRCPPITAVPIAAQQSQITTNIHRPSPPTTFEDDDIIDECEERPSLHIDMDNNESDRQSCQAIVEDIRMNEFGVGSDALRDSPLVASFNRKMARLVDHLSSDLYGNASHFVLELVQNADDNRYATGTARPTLNLCWQMDSSELVLMVRNNEVGFTERDLRSLCDIGASTKGAHNNRDESASLSSSSGGGGKIGRKGIGFKSVFLVTDRPEIHSNGFHVRFERFSRDDNNKRVANNGLVPSWCDPPKNHSKSGATTTILLPITATLARGDIRQSVASQLRPYLLLFLRNLTRISITSCEPGSSGVADVIERSIELEKESAPNRRVIITNTGERHSWVICTRRLPVTDANLRQLSPRGLPHTELSVAISDTDENPEEDLRDWPAFAFLPIRSYGLRFIVNADFAIPASREDIVHASPWNKWLIGRLGDIFTDHLCDVAAKVNGDDVQSIMRLLDCVPLPGEVPGDSSFHALIPQLRGSLSTLAWLPDRLGRLHQPQQLIAELLHDGSGEHNNKESAAALTAVLCQRLQLSLLHPTIAGSASERHHRVLHWLGCQSLSLSHLSKLLAALGPTDYSDRQLMRAIIVAIHGALERDSLESAVTTQRVIFQLRSLPIWPVKAAKPHGRGNHQPLLSVSNSPVPLFMLPTTQTDNSGDNIDPYNELCRVICPIFIASYDMAPAATGGEGQQHQQNVAISILQRLGVPELSNASMIAHAISPFLHQSQSRDWFISVGQFLVDQCHPSQYRDTVLPQLSFATVSHSTDGTSSPTMSTHRQLPRTHLPPAMEALTHSGVVSLLRNNIDYVTVDEAYSCGGKLRPAQLREFFLAAGVSETFAICDSKALPEVAALLDLERHSVNIELLRYLDRNWALFPIEVRSGPLSSELASRVCIPVCTTAAADALCLSDEELLQLPLQLRQPHDSVVLYLTNGDPNKSLICDSLLAHFPFCPVVFTNDALPQLCGMTAHIRYEHVAALMHRVLVTRAVRLSSRQARDIYQWIGRELSPTALANLFVELRSALDGALLIALPNSADVDLDEPCDLVLESRCYWTLPIAESGVTKASSTAKNIVFLQDQQVQEDLKQLLNQSTNQSCDHRPLVKLFPDLRELFVDVMRVRPFPAVRDVWPSLELLLRLVGPDRLADQLNHAELELITDVYNLVQFLDQHHDNGQHRSDLLQLPLIPCIHGGFRAFSDNSERFTIYAWRSYETVHTFRQHSPVDNDDAEDARLDFLTIDCFPHVRRDQTQMNHGQNCAPRCSAAQFLLHYFNPPVIEDEMRFLIDNRAQFQTCVAVKSMLAHLEVIVSQWFQRNVSRDGAAHCVNMLSAITDCASCSTHPVEVAVSLRNRPHSVHHRYEHSVYIGPTPDNRHGTFEMLLGGIDLATNGRMSALDGVMDALIAWILAGDSFTHLRDRFRKFYRSLFDLIESSDRNQVSIFIRSHNLRINPFSIDYIYETFATHAGDSVEAATFDDELDDGRLSRLDSPAARSDRSDRSERSLSRRVCVSIEAGDLLAQQWRLKDDDDDDDKDDGEYHPKPERKIKRRLCEISTDDASESLAKQRRLNDETERDDDRRSTVAAIGCGVDRSGSPLSMRVRDQCTTNQKYLSLSTSAGAATGDSVAHISGRIGEQLAFEKLSIGQSLGEWEIVRVDWVNQHAESRLPYDFKLSARRPDSTVPEVIYLEVKATTQPNKRQFDLSPQEVTAAWSFKEFYHLLLVFHSGKYPDKSNHIKFVHIPDTLGQLQDNQCKLLLDVGDLLAQ